MVLVEALGIIIIKSIIPTCKILQHPNNPSLFNLLNPLLYSTLLRVSLPPLPTRTGSTLADPRHNNRMAASVVVCLDSKIHKTKIQTLVCLVRHPIHNRMGFHHHLDKTNKTPPRQFSISLPQPTLHPSLALGAIHHLRRLLHQPLVSVSHQHRLQLKCRPTTLQLSQTSSSISAALNQTPQAHQRSHPSHSASLRPLQTSLKVRAHPSLFSLDLVSQPTRNKQP